MLINRVKFSELTAAVAELGYNVSTCEEGGKLFASAVPLSYQLFKKENEGILAKLFNESEEEDTRIFISLLIKEGYSREDAEDICNFYSDFARYTSYYSDDFYSQGFTEGTRKIIQILVGIRTTFDIRLWGGLILVALLEYDYSEI